MRYQELEDTVFILNSLANKTKNFVVAALETAAGIPKPKKGEKPSKEDTLIHAALSYSLVQVSAFIDEWERQFLALKGKGIEADRIAKVENIVEPALTVIYSFTGLRDYRNWALAHNLRIKSLGYANALRGNHVASLKVPITLFDYQLVADCVTICAEMVRVEFKEYYIKPSDFIEANSGLNLPVGITNAEYNQQKEVIKIEVARRWETLSPYTWKEFSKGGDVREH